MTRWLVRFGFDGRPFAGWARQPGRRTVEGEIRGALARCGIAPDPAAARLEVASRTDRGVSARANALALSSDLDGRSLLHALNGVAPEIFFPHATEVPEAFRVRTPLWREYRYYLPLERIDRGRWPAWFPWFTGSPIDVRSFARGVASGTPVRRPIDEMELLDVGGTPVLRIRAPGFLWGMVRKIVSALEAVGEDRIPPATLFAALQGRARLTVPLAPAEPLVLWEVAHGVPFSLANERWPRRQGRYFRSEYELARSRERLLRELPLLEDGGAAAPPRPSRRQDVGPRRPSGE